MSLLKGKRVPFQNFDEATNNILHMMAGLLKITKLLNLLGVQPILTGLRPETALQTNQQGFDLKKVMVEANLERALAKIGFTLEKK